MKIEQFRYGISKALDNITKTKLCSSEGILSDRGPIVKLRVQGLPGTKFFFKAGEQDDFLLIGFDGIFELDIEGLTTINHLRFENASINYINASGTALIIDVVYSKEVNL